MDKFFEAMGSRIFGIFVLVSVLMLVSTSAVASQVTGISLMDSDSGDVLRIDTDAPLEYQLFDLDGPPRMVVSFPAASLTDGLAPIKDDGDGVTSVFPVKDKNGVRLEIGLSELIGYKVEESGNSITIKFSAIEEADGKTVSSAMIKDIEVRDRGTSTELILRGDNMDASHNAFLTDNNQTMILDFWGGSSSLAKENYKYASQRIRDVTIGDADGRVRLVIGLLATDKVKQQIDVSKGELVIRLGDIASKRNASSLVVEDVSFQPDDRIAHLLIRTDSVNPIVNITEKENSVVIDLKKSHLAQGQERSQDVSAFPGPIRQVDSYPMGENVRIVARLRDEVDITSFQQGNIFTINLEPQDLRVGKSSGEDDKFIYSGKKVTFDFKDMDITNALKLISEMSNLNIIMSDNVKGSLTMRLVDVPWDQALDIILSSQGLGKQVEGNVMRIAPIAVLRQENKDELEGIKDVEMLEPLITEPITLSFARVNEIERMLKASQKKESKDSASDASVDSATIFSPRGSYIVDQRTNTLIVTDTANAINNVKRFISIIDRPIEQVLIETRIVEATDSFTQEFGIRWGGQFTNNRTALNGGPNLQVGAANPTASNGFLVDLPAAAAATSGGAVGLSFGAISKALNLDLELSAAEVEGDAKIVSSPRILTANGAKAVIAQGNDVPYVTPASGTDPATVEFKKAELRLEVTPQITANRTVIMEIDINKDAPTGATVQGNPILATKSISTNLQVKDGETIVIGGIFTRETSANEDGVPGLKEIPILGWLFKTKSVGDDKTELLIFLTPTIVKGDVE